MHVFFSKTNMGIFIFCFIVIAYILPSVFTVTLTHFGNFKTKTGISCLLPCHLFFPVFCHVYFFIPEICLESWIKENSFKSLYALSPACLSLEQYCCVCCHTPCVEVGFFFLLFYFHTGCVFSQLGSCVSFYKYAPYFNNGCSLPSAGLTWLTELLQLEWIATKCA